MKKLLLPLALLLTVASCTTTSNPYGASKQETSPGNRARLHTELGAAYYEQRQLSVALEEYTEALKIDPKFPPAYNGLGLVYSSLNEDAKAESNFKQALGLDPGSSETHNNYGTFLCSRNRIDESIEQFMLAVKNPVYQTPQLAYLNAAKCVLKKNDNKAAEKYLIKALEFQPNLRQAQYQLAAIHFERGQYVLAREELRQAMQDIEPGPEMLWLGIRIERKLGNRNAEQSYGMQLKQKYMNSEQAKAYLSGQ